MLACASALGILCIEDVDDPDARRGPVNFGKTALSALALLTKDAKCACMIPMNFAFGFGASYLNGYFMSAVVAPGKAGARVRARRAVVKVRARRFEDDRSDSFRRRSHVPFVRSVSLSHARSPPTPSLTTD